MSKDAVFTMKLETALRDEFMAEAEHDHRPASQIVRELMRGYVQQRRQAREYDAFLNSKVEVSRQSVQLGRGRSNSDVETTFAARRKRASVLKE